MILGLNNLHHHQMRSHSTEKQSTTFLSKLDSKVSQMAQDDSNMITRNSQVLGGNSNNINSIKKNKQTCNIQLPRTGIEHPYMKQRPKFNENHREFEPIHCMNVSKSTDNFI